MNNSVPVVVAYHGGIGALAIARSLGRLGVPTYLIAKKELSPVSSSRFWIKKFWWDFSAPEDESLQFLLDVGRQIGGRPILLTLADWVAIFIEDHANSLQDRFIFPRTRAPVIRMLANKWQMFLAAKKHGIPTPEAVYPQRRDDVVTFLEAARFPIMMKGADPFQENGKYKEIIVNRLKLLESYDRLAASGPPNVILQEYIPGDADSVWMCNAYFASGSACRAIISGKKLRQVSSTGIASLAICSPNETVEKQTRQFMQAVRYEGCVGIGWRYDARDEQYKVLDVNPRVSGVFRLFRATNGMDVVRVCYLDLTRQAIPESAPSIGRKWMLEEDFYAAFSQMREGKLTFRQWLRSLRGVRETQWLAVDDPLPILVWLWPKLWPMALSVLRQARRIAWILPWQRLRSWMHAERSKQAALEQWRR